MFFPLCQAAEKRLSWHSWFHAAPCWAAPSMHLVGFGEQSINISEGIFNRCLFAQTLLNPSLVVAMVKHADLNRKMSTGWRGSFLVYVCQLLKPISPAKGRLWEGGEAALDVTPARQSRQCSPPGKYCWISPPLVPLSCKLRSLHF